MIKKHVLSLAKSNEQIKKVFQTLLLGLCFLILSLFKLFSLHRAINFYRIQRKEKEIRNITKGITKQWDYMFLKHGNKKYNKRYHKTVGLHVFKTWK